MFTEWFRANAVRLSTLDPDAALDELEPLRDLAGSARVVAVGENAHFVREFTLARKRVLRFLAQRCGFEVFAFEFSFGEAFALEGWLAGAGAEEDLATVSPAAAGWGAGDLMRFLRRHNATADRPLRLAGIDIPEAGGTLLPALGPVGDYVREVDPELAGEVEAAVAVAKRFAGGSAAAAAPAWGKLDTAEQDALTAGLARLVLRFRALEPRYVELGGRTRYDVARRQLESAWHTDYMLRAMAGLFAGTGLPGDVSVRDRFMAESVRWHLEHSPPDTRVVLAAHNNHIQKTPVCYDGQLASLPMGQQLAGMLGADYVSLAVIHTADHTAEMVLDASAPAGFTVADMPVVPPEEGSVEHAAHGLGLGLVDLRDADPAGAPDRIRSQSGFLHTPVLEAFDGVLFVPTVTVEEELDL